MGVFDMTPEAANNLLNFGFSTMSASGTPGIPTLAALGKGGEGMNQAAQQRAQTQYLGAETANKLMTNRMLQNQLNMLSQPGLLDDNSPDQSPPIPQNQNPPGNSVGQTWSPTAGSTRMNTKPVNNPGNLRPVGATQGFQQFSTPEDGLTAMRMDLAAKINGSPAMKGQTPSLRNIIATYAPASENNTAAYIENISKQSGISPNQILTEADIDKILPAMVKQEGNASALPPQRNFGQGVGAQSQDGIPQPSPGSLRRAYAIGQSEPRLGAAIYTRTMAPTIAAQEAAARLPFAAQEASATERGKALETQAEKVDTEAANAVQAKYLLDNVLTAARQVPTGKFAQYKEQYLAYKNALGMSNPEEDKLLANYQDLDKNAIALRTQAVRQITSRPTQMEFVQVGEALPNKSLSQGGLDLIGNQAQAVNEWQIAKQQAQTQWRNTHKTMEGFETEFNSKVSPAVFLAQRLPHDDFAVMAANLQKTPKGQKTLAGLMEKMKYAQESGLFE